MANAKLWWDGSSWGPSEETCVYSYSGSGSSWARVLYRIWLIAYDDATIKMTAKQQVTVNIAGSGSMSGSKTVKSGSTTIGSGSFTADVTPYTTFTWSGQVTCGVRETGTMIDRTGSGLGVSGTVSITASPFVTVSFSANGGSGAPAAQAFCKGASSALPDGVPARTGYGFLGWSRSPSAATAEYTAGGTIIVDEDTALYAVWQADGYALTISKPATATLTILRNGEVFTGNTVYHDDVLTITAATVPGYRISSLKVNCADFVSGGTHTVSGAVAIEADTVAQASAIATCDSAVETLGLFSLTVNRYSTSHYNKLRCYDSNSVLLYTSAAFTDAASLIIPQSWFADFGSVTSIPVRAVVTTYADPACTVVHGESDSCTFTVTADPTMRPTLAAGFLTLTPVDPGDSQTIGPGRLTDPGFVKGYSKVRAVFDTGRITHAAGASAGTYAISFQGIATSGSGTTLVSGNTITVAGTLAVTYTVTDSRGRQTSGTQTIFVNDYASPAIASLNCFRCDSALQPDEDEPYMAVTAECTFTQLSDNAITITVEAKPTGGSYTSYGTLTNATQSRIGGAFLPDTSYFVKVTVTDTVGNSAYTEMSMPRRAWVFHMRQSPGGPGAAFGKVTEHDRALQLADGWSFMMDDTVLSEADLVYLLGLDTLIGNTALPTTAQTITGAIAELEGECGVTDVTVDGSSVVTGGVAAVDLTGKSDVGHSHVTSDITDFPACLRMKLLWTNPDPGATFSAQTVSLDLSGYDAVMLSFRLSVASGSTDLMGNAFAFVGQQVNMCSMNAGSTAHEYKRLATVSSSGVDFGNGMRGTTAGAQYSVPQRICGIKGIT